jgi:hypothetical protein
MAIAVPPALSMACTTDAAASAPFEYVIATLAPSAARRFAIAAPMPREPPVTSATFFVNLDTESPLVFCEPFTTAWIWVCHNLPVTLRWLSDVSLLHPDLLTTGIEPIPLRNARLERESRLRECL